MAAATAALLVGTVVSAGVSAYSQYSAGRTQNSIAKRNAEAMRAAALQNYGYARESGRRERINAERMEGAVRARLAGQGGVIATGVDLNIMGETAERLKVRELDAFQAASLQQKALFDQAEMTEWEGKQAQKAATIGAGTTLLAGLARSGSSFYQSKQSGSLLDI